MKPRKRASLSGLVVVELVSGRRVIVSPDDLPRLGALPPIASVRLAFESVILPNDAWPVRSGSHTRRLGSSSRRNNKKPIVSKGGRLQRATCQT